MSAKPPKGKVRPQPTALTQPFWNAANNDQLLLQVGSVTGRAQFFPRSHGLQAMDATEWSAASGLGSLLAVTVCRVPAPGFEGEAPYAMGIVKLAEGPRVLAQIVAPDPAALRVGMAVRLQWDRAREQQQVYCFAPA